MPIRIEPYHMKYWSDVCALAKKGFHYPDGYDFDLNYKQMFEYEWEKKIDEDEFPYKYGMVLIDGNQVVGFLGAYYSKREISANGTDEFEELVYMNCTRYVIKKEYRIYIFSAIKKLMQGVDVVTDFTSRPSMHEVFTKAFKFHEYSCWDVRFYPVPFIKQETVKIEEVNEQDLPISRKVLLRDHKKYGVKVFRFCDEREVGYVFWSKIFSSKYNSEYIRVLCVDNKEMFSRNVWQIMWTMQKECFCNTNSISDIGIALFERIKNNQLYLAECDISFLNIDAIEHPLYLKWPVHRLFLDRRKTTQNKPELDFLYSELCMNNVGD